MYLPIILPRVHFAKKVIGEEFKVVYRFVVWSRPIECELIAAIRIIREVSGVYPVGDDEKLNVVKESIECGLLVSLNLIICLLQFNAPFLQLNLHKRKTIYNDSNVKAVLPLSLNCYLVRHLKLVFAPILGIEEINPDTLSVFEFKFLQVTKLLGLLEARSTFKIKQNLVKFRLSERRAAVSLELVCVMLLKLSFEIGLKFILIIENDTFITVLNQGFDQPFLQNLFTLYRHIIFQKTIYGKVSNLLKIFKCHCYHPHIITILASVQKQSR